MISIIIPFNNLVYLKNCLKKLHSMKMNNMLNNIFEIILINDFAKEGIEGETYKIIKNYSTKLNLKYYKVPEKTIGVGNARNIGIEKASGKYIMFLDVDDTLDKNLLNNLQEYIEDDIEMIKYKMRIIKNGREFLTNEISFEKTDGQDAFNRLCYCDKYIDSPCLYVIKKELFNRTNLKFEKNVYHEDFGLIPQLIVNAKSIVSLNYYGYNYYQSENSIMRNTDYEKQIKKVQDKIALYNKMVRNLEIFQITEQTRANLLTYYTNSIIFSLKDLKKHDRKKFENRIKKQGILNNLQPKSFRQFAKKILLKTNMEMYYKYIKNY